MEFRSKEVSVSTTLARDSFHFLLSLVSIVCCIKEFSAVKCGKHLLVLNLLSTKSWKILSLIGKWRSWKVLTWNCGKLLSLGNQFHLHGKCSAQMWPHRKRKKRNQMIRTYISTGCVFAIETSLDSEFIQMWLEKKNSIFFADYSIVFMISYSFMVPISGKKLLGRIVINCVSSSLSLFQLFISGVCNSRTSRM